MALIQARSFSHPEVTSGDGSVKRRPVMADFAPGMWTLRCVERAQQDTMPQKAALDDMLIDRSQWHQQLLGLGHLSLLRIGMLPEAFWRAFFHYVSDHYGWNYGVIRSVSKPETPREQVERARAAIAENYLVILKYEEEAVKE